MNYNLFNKLMGLAKKSLPNWMFVLFLIFLLIDEQLKHHLSETIYDLSIKIIMLIIGAIITVTYLSFVENRKNKNSFLVNSYYIIQKLSQQYLQLTNLKKEIEKRISLINKYTSKEQKIPREEMLLMIQEFKEDYDRIESEKLTPLIILPSDIFKNFLEKSQLVLSADKSYFKSIHSILKTNDVKLHTSKEENGLRTLLNFYQRHMPSLLEQINYSLEINKNANKSFQNELKTIFGKKFNETHYGEAYTL